MISNPDRTTRGGRAEAELSVSPDTSLIVGADLQKNDHSLRTAMGMGATIPSIDSMVRKADAEFRTLGLFSELTHQLNKENRLKAGIRLDDSKATARKTPNFGGATPGTSDDSTNVGGFLRLERDLAALPITLYAGLGRTERSPDFWERNKQFFLDTEKNSQLDLGASYHSAVVRGNLSLFYIKIDDYILLHLFQKTPTALTTALNVDATLYGGEADLTWYLPANFQLTATIAYTHGDDDTFNTALSQVAPPEATLGLAYDDRVWSAGLLLRGVDKQDRVHPDFGSIVGQDIGETPGFATVSINGGYRSAMGLLITAGVDNLLDKSYAEHISKAGVAVSGFEQISRVNEPGRFFWLKASIDI
jgi:iron complex outermembrane receptor protein